MYECKCSKYSHMILIYSIKKQNRDVKCYFKKISIQGHRAKQQVWSRGRKKLGAITAQCLYYVYSGKKQGKR